MDFRQLRKRRQSNKNKPPEKPAKDLEPAERPEGMLEEEQTTAPETVLESDAEPEEAYDFTESAFIQSLSGAEDDENYEYYREILRFRLSSEHFALYLDEIEEIIKPKNYTVVPRMPAWVLGIVSLRGTMVPVIDLGLRLSIQAESPSTQRIIIISHEGDLCGLLVDEVRNVELIDPDTIESIPAAISDSAGRFLSGLTRLAGKDIESEQESEEPQTTDQAKARNEKKKKSELVSLVDIAAILNLEGKSLERTV